MSLSNVVSIVFGIVIAITTVSAYRDGAPASVCGSLTPHHKNYQPQTKDSPYTLNVSRDSSTPDWTLNLTLEGDTADDYIKGFLVQARDDNEIIGRFTITDFDFSQLLTCDKRGDSITHKAIRSHDLRSISFQWKAPAHFTGPFRFHYTVVKNKQTFWADITEDVEFRGSDNLV